MRLIDADALREGFEAADFDDDPFENCDNAARIVRNAPTINAIPVEWLNDRIYDMKRAPLYRRYAEMLLMEWLQEQKEQEAQDG